MNVKIKKADKVKVEHSAEIFDIMRRILLRENKIDRAKEHLWTVGLDAGLHILYIELISVGGSYSTVVEPMQIFRVGVLKGAVHMLMVHNHPSGSLTPSFKDLDLTDKLIQCGYILDIKVVDHLIISEKDYMSFKNEGMMEQLEKSKAYVPPYKLKEQLKAEQEKLLRQKAKAEEKKDIARQMKIEGYSIEQIAKLTGLSESVIKRLRAVKKKATE